MYATITFMNKSKRGTPSSGRPFIHAAFYIPIMCIRMNLHTHDRD